MCDRADCECCRRARKLLKEQTVLLRRLEGQLRERGARAEVGGDAVWDGQRELESWGGEFRPRRES